MSTELIKKATNAGLSALAGGAAALVAAANSAGVAGTSGKRLTHSGRTGEWKCSMQPVDEGKTFIFDMMGVRQQWMAWKDQRPINHFTEKLLGGQPLPAEEDLPDHWNGRQKGSDGWQKNLVFDIYDPDTGDTLEVSLKGDKESRPACKLITEFGTKAKAHRDENGAEMLPVVEIGDSTFFSKVANETFHSPTLKIVGWVSQAEVDALLSTAAADAGDDAPDATADEAPSASSVSADEQRPAPARRTGRRI